MQAIRTNYSVIDFFEQDLNVKNLIDATEREQAHILRYKIFVNELRWVPPHKSGLEIDRYDDEGMVPLGLLDQAGRLLAHLRITLPQRTFMMEQEFAALIETPISKTASTVEVSRVCTEADTRGMRLQTPYGVFFISMLLYKGLYHWCCQNFIHDMCMVIENKLARLLSMAGFPCRKLGKPVIMPDGVSAVAVRIDWREFYSINQASKPQLLDWFNSVESMKKAA